MPASRLLSTLMLPQTRGRMSAPDLAKELEVSIRTVYRDIDQLSAAERDGRPRRKSGNNPQ